jgi:hypothetical protein
MHTYRREVRHIDNLEDQLEGTRDQSLRGDDCSQDRDDEGRPESTWRGGIEERIAVSFGISRDKGSLTWIVLASYLVRQNIWRLDIPMYAISKQGYANDSQEI